MFFYFTPLRHFCRRMSVDGLPRRIPGSVVRETIQRRPAQALRLIAMVGRTVVIDSVVILSGAIVIMAVAIV